jgi:electron transport complex protein RnfG
MLRAMVGVGFACGLLIVTAFIGTRPTIERNRAEALRHAILEVLPGARAHESFAWLEDGRFVRSPVDAGASGADGPRVYAGYNESRELVGLAVEAAGMGYQDVIRVLYGYSSERAAIVGLRVLESRETPGLGDRIETDPVFRANFDALDVSLAEDLEGLAHPIEAVKHGAKEHAWQIDGITGATISSQAIADILRRSAQTWIPRIRRRLADFDGGR